jgi:hypothetical protein
MAESQNDILDLIRDSNDPNLYIYDPRARYKPRRHRHRRSRAMTYDPRRRRSVRSYFSGFRRRIRRPSRKGAKAWSKKVFSLEGGLFAAGFGIGAIGASTAGDRNWIMTGQSTTSGRIKYTIWDAVLRLSFGMVNLGPSFGIPAGVTPPSGTLGGWNWTKFISSKYMWGGIGLFALSMVPGMKERRKLRMFALGLAIGGGYGGGTDPSATTTAAMKTGPQITRPMTAALAPSATYATAGAPIPSVLTGGLSP